MENCQDNFYFQNIEFAKIIHQPIMYLLYCKLLLINFYMKFVSPVWLETQILMPKRLWGSLDFHSLEYLFEYKMPQFQEFRSHDYLVFPIYILFKIYLQFIIWYLKLWVFYLVQLSLLLSKRKLLSIRTRIPLRHTAFKRKFKSSAVF